MPVLEFFPIETKRGRGFFPRFAVPAVGQDDCADVPKEGGDFGQVDSSASSQNSSTRQSNVSKDAWKLWLEYSKMVMNEYHLNPLDPNSQKIMGEQMEQFFFGEGAKLPEGYVPPKAKG